MKRIGLLGGMSWESSREYYRLLNEAVRERLGGLHSADLLLASLDFAPLAEAMSRNDWDFILGVINDAAASLVNAGAELLLICTNTMHKLADNIAAAVAPVPLLHIADAVAVAANHRKLQTVALLGTKFTMEEAFYRQRLEGAGLTVLTPDASEREWLDQLIFSELCVGVFRDEAREKLLSIVEKLKLNGAEGLVLGCTELPLLVDARSCPLPIFDTLQLHVQAAIEEAFANKNTP